MLCCWWWQFRVPIRRGTESLESHVTELAAKAQETATEFSRRKLALEIERVVAFYF